MFTVQVITKGLNPSTWMKNIEDKIHNEMKDVLIQLGEETANRMGEVITISAKRFSTGRLASNIKSEVLSSIGDEIHIGIGNINDLKQNAPYFEVLDAGGYVPPTNLGFFEGDPAYPVSGGTGQKWIHTGDSGKGNYLMRPHKAIEGINYIGIASEELKQHIEQQLNNILK